MVAAKTDLCANKGHVFAPGVLAVLLVGVWVGHQLLTPPVVKNRIGVQKYDFLLQIKLYIIFYYFLYKQLHLIYA